MESHGNAPNSSALNSAPSPLDAAWKINFENPTYSLMLIAMFQCLGCGKFGRLCKRCRRCHRGLCILKTDCPPSAPTLRAQPTIRVPRVLLAPSLLPVPPIKRQYKFGSLISPGVLTEIFLFCSEPYRWVDDFLF